MMRKLNANKCHVKCDGGSLAQGKKTGGRDFEPGWKGGPGRPGIPEDLKQARKLLRDEFERICHKLISMTKEELIAFQKNPQTDSLGLMLSSIIVKANNQGDQKRLEFILERLIGPVPKAIEIGDPGGEPFRPFATLGPDQLTKGILALQKLIKEEECKSTPKQQPSSALPAPLSSPSSRRGSPTE